MTDTILSKLGKAMYATAPWVRTEGSITREVGWDDLPEQTRAMYEGFAAAAGKVAAAGGLPDVADLIHLDDAYRLAVYELQRFRAAAHANQDTVDVLARIRAARRLLGAALERRGLPTPDAFEGELR